MTTDIEKAELGARTLGDFLQPFENEIAQSVLSILLEELMNAKVVSILSESQQTGDQSHHGIEESINCDFQIDILGVSTTSSDMAEPNSTIDSGSPDAIRTVGGDSGELQRSAGSFEGQRVY